MTTPSAGVRARRRDGQRWHAGQHRPGRQHDGDHAPTVTAPADRTSRCGPRSPSPVGQRQRRRRPDVPVGAERQGAAGTAPALVDNARSTARCSGSSALRRRDRRGRWSPRRRARTSPPQPDRTFPDMAQVLAGNTNAQTGTARRAADDPTVVRAVPLDCYSEFLPTNGYVGTAGTNHARPALPPHRARRRPGRRRVSHDDVTLRSTRTPDPSWSRPRRVASWPAAARARHLAVNGTRRWPPGPGVLSTDGGSTWRNASRRTANDGQRSSGSRRRPRPTPGSWSLPSTTTSSTSTRHRSRSPSERRRVCSGTVGSPGDG